MSGNEDTSINMCIKRVQITTVMCGLRPLLFSVLRLHVETCMVETCVVETCMVWRDVYGRDVYGRDMCGRDVCGRDVYGKVETAW